jgi:hypothetical protein
MSQRGFAIDGLSTSIDRAFLQFLMLAHFISLDPLNNQR